MSADDAAARAGGAQPDTWNGVPVPPRPPLPPLPDEQAAASTTRPDSEQGEKPEASEAVTRPGFIGLPPGMQADIDTIPASAGTPAPDVAPVPAPDDSTSDCELEFEDGTRIAVDGSILIGRDPNAQSTFPDAQSIAVVDVSRSMSKTHAAVQWSRGAVWVTDLNSTNGTRIIDASGRETACVPGVPTPAPRDGGILFGRALASLRARGSDGTG
ncbi:FHA domain-containing protein [Paramicrobacterium agarici]|uniref:FHA domain-containing protein n=1 Tax=Paramicrobacterium agarici TaxID=630514 RepID=UPI0011526B84|nr:FHA domain-containing protein [Microbacterium agarici]TQO22051.1 FHA domain-containing protein [Microbacterium agarici]